MALKKISKFSLLCFIATVLFAGVAINRMLSGDSTVLVIVMLWLSAIAFVAIGFRELAKSTKK